MQTPVVDAAAGVRLDRLELDLSATSFDTQSLEYSVANGQGQYPADGTLCPGILTVTATATTITTAKDVTAGLSPCTLPWYARTYTRDGSALVTTFGSVSVRLERP